VEFRLLGPVEACVSGKPVPIGGPKPRALLTALLLDRGRSVTVHRLVDAIWGDQPPTTARALVQTYVSTLRQALRPHAAARTIVTTAWGYLVDVPPETLDREVFERLLDQGRRAAAEQRHADAAGLFTEAAGLWRGPALGGPGGSYFDAEAARLEEAHLEALRGRGAALLALGRLDGLETWLRPLVARHPGCETLRAQLMTVLLRQDRRADALAVFRDGRRFLAEELGVDPGAELTGLYRKVLRPDGPRPRRSQPTPAQLPASPADFTGRAAELQMIRASLTPGAAHRGLPVHVVTGGGGTGKSMLAVRAAHELAPHFTDGQLYADLTDPADEPVDPRTVLGRFLRALEADPSSVPPSTGERAAQFRSMLAGRRVLLVLDDAATADQVASLLPGSPTCAVLVTSRTRLGGLAAERTSLSALPERDALALLGRIAGAGRIEAEPAATVRVLAACAGLPLAVRVAGDRLAARPGLPVRALAERLSDERHRLDELSDDGWGVRTSLDRGYRRLDQAARDALRALAASGAERFSAQRVGDLLGLSEPAADAIAARLADAHLLATDRERYRLPALVRQFADEQDTDRCNSAAGASSDSEGRAARVSPSSIT
jgi:DNA-binding SARP family transcriptional activator